MRNCKQLLNVVGLLSLALFLFACQDEPAPPANGCAASARSAPSDDSFAHDGTNYAGDGRADSHERAGSQPNPRNAGCDDCGSAASL